MKNLRYLRTATAVTLLSLICASARAITLLPTDDTTGTNVFTGRPPAITRTTVASASGKSTTLHVSKKFNAFIQFNVGDMSIAPNSVTQARLTLYIPTVKKLGDLTLHLVTNSWTETFTGPTLFDFRYVIFATGNGFTLDTGGAFIDTDGDGIPNWWELSYAGSTSVMQAGGDIDGDGINNFLEFTFGSNPANAARGALIYNGTMAGGGAITATGLPITVREGNAFYALFVRRTDYVAARLSYTVLFCTDLTDWTPSAAAPTVLANDGTYQIVGVPYPALASGKRGLFFRVQVSFVP